MSLMDFGCKGISWVGNIYQKLDNIVNQDAAKYLEDQVNTAGESVKRFCSDIVKDFNLPPLGDPVKSETQPVVLKGNAANSAYDKSNVGTGEVHGHTGLLNQPSYFESVKNGQLKSYTDFCPVNQLVIPTSSGETLEQAKSDLDPANDALKLENSHVNAEKNTIVEKSNAVESSVIKKISVNDEVLKTSLKVGMGSNNSAGDSDSVLDASGTPKAGTVCGKYADAFDLQYESIDSNPEEPRGFLAETPPTTSVLGKELQTSMQAETVRDDSAEEADCINALKVGTFCDNAAADDSESTPELIDYNPENASEFLAESLPTLVNGEELQTSLQVVAVCDNFTDDADPISEASNTQVGRFCDYFADDSYCESGASSLVSLAERAFSDASSEKSLVEKKRASSSSSIFTEPLTLSGVLIDDIRAKLASSSNPASVASHESCGSIVLLPSMSSSTISSQNKIVDTALSNSFLQSELIGNFEEFGINDDMSDWGMENIDLSDEVKVEDSCVIVDNSMLYEAYCKTRRLRSYKKRIQDVLTSKRKLTKEYEMLAILHGDLDTVSSQGKGQRNASSGITKPLEANLQHDLDWELL